LGTYQAFPIVPDGGGINIAGAAPGGQAVCVPGGYAVLGLATFADFMVASPPLQDRTAAIQTQQPAYRAEIITERPFLIDQPYNHGDGEEEQEKYRHSLRVAVRPKGADKPQQGKAVKKGDSPARDEKAGNLTLEADLTKKRVDKFHGADLAPHPTEQHRADDYQRPPQRPDDQGSQIGISQGTGKLFRNMGRCKTAENQQTKDHKSQNLYEDGIRP